jgi:1-acyl-sn-glycerol-3-phosphate acyltransferase
MVRRILSPFLTVVAVTGLVLATLILGLTALVMARVRPRSRKVDRIIRWWGRTFLFITATRVEAHGLEHIDPKASYVFTPNHISNIDIPTMLGTLPVSGRYLAKKELYSVPILGPAMRAVLMIETDRDAGPAAHREINEQVAKVVAARLSLIIHPEGTRSRNAELRPFKKGAFRIAIDNGLPVVPVTIVGADRVWRPGGKLIYGGRVRLLIHEPIATTAMTAADIGDLRDRVRAIVERSYSESRVES